MKKRLVLITLLLCVVFALAGCACKHENAAIVNQLDADCLNDGYTGDRTFACKNLRSIKLPAALQTRIATLGNLPIETLNLPQGFTMLQYDINLNQLKTIVWPLLFVDRNKVLVNAKPEIICYEGSEIQWKTLYGDLYPEANMVYNYDYTVPVE